MTPRRWYAIACLLTLVAVPMLGSAQTTQVGRVFNNDCQLAPNVAAGDDPFSIPGWTNFDGSPTPTPTARVDGLGAGQSAACVVVGHGVLQSLAFGVTGGETIVNFSADVWEIRDDCGDGASGLLGILCSEPVPTGGPGIVRGDSVVAIEFFYCVDTDGDTICDLFQNLYQFEMHCDDILDARDNGAFDGSDGCTVDDTHNAIWAKHDATDFECDSADLDVIDAAGVIQNYRCAKYDGIICNHVDPARNDEDCTTTSKVGGCVCVAPFANPLLVPALATQGHVLLGGSLALDPVDPLFTGTGLDSPTSITAFDNIVVL